MGSEIKSYCDILLITEVFVVFVRLLLLFSAKFGFRDNEQVIILLSSSAEHQLSLF